MKTRNTVDLSDITPGALIANIRNIKEPQSELNLIALFILVDDHFVDKTQEQIKSSLCRERVSKTERLA
jgi:hypothetical protein